MPNEAFFDELKALEELGAKEVAFAFGDEEKPTKEAPKKKEEPKKEEPKVEPEAEEVEEETTDEGTESEEVQESEEAEEEVVEGTLRDKLAEMLTTLQSQPAPKEETKEEKKEEAPKPIAFFTEEDLTDMTADKLNAQLNKVYQLAQQDALRAATATVAKTVEEMVNIRMTVSDFYRDNPDLVKYKPIVQVVVAAIQKQHPDWDLNKVIGELGKESRSILGLKDPKAQDAKSKKPAFAKAPGARKVTPTPGKKPSGVRAEVMELLNRRS